ncbi:hypothetical protein vBAspALolek_27 [Aeromonas phage vB_AspA_Lolek]|nr:hypothetical protein vBAspALolek_27 [Aeromonas phage vB_AspA_Lolek]
MKVNILFTIEEMARRRAQAGNADPGLHVHATGRSTGTALSAIGLAMQQGNQGVVFDAPIDHYQKPPAPIAPSAPCAALYSHAERESQDRQMLLMQDLVDKLGLEGFTFNKVSRTYSYQVIYEV